MKKYKKLLIFGGTFSPVHNGHLRAMQMCCAATAPDVLYVIPTATPPHKVRHDGATDKERMDMLHLAVGTLHIACPVVVSDIELLRGGASYTVDTVEALSPLADRILVYCGTDMLLTLDEWHDAARLMRAAEFVCMQREGDARLHDAILHKIAALQNTYGARITLIPDVPFEVSSSEIRASAARGETIELFVPHGVADYIAVHGLYMHDDN